MKSVWVDWNLIRNSSFSLEESWSYKIARWFDGQRFHSNAHDEGWHLGLQLLHTSNIMEMEESQWSVKDGESKYQRSIST